MIPSYKQNRHGQKFESGLSIQTLTNRRFRALQLMFGLDSSTGTGYFSCELSQIPSGRCANAQSGCRRCFHHFMRAGGTCIANGAEAREPHLPSYCGRIRDDEHCSKFRSSAALNGTSCAGEQMGGTARMIHEHFCSNRGFAATTNLDAVGTASR